MDAIGLGESTYSPIYMSYTLISSRTRSTDESFVLVEPELSADTIMVEALSFLSRFRRVAGWMYQTIPSTPGNYERTNGQMVLFGRNRLDLTYHGQPFGLEFFPRYGNTNFALSVYTGFAAPPSPPPRPNVVVVPGTTIEVYRESSSGLIFWAANSEGPFSQIGWTLGSVAAKVGADGRLFVAMGYPNYRYSWGPPWMEMNMNEGNWAEISSFSGTLNVPSN